MTTVARFFLMVTGILLLAHYLPAVYWLVADQPQRAPVVFYSVVNKEFLLVRSSKGEVRRTDTAGTVYEREEFERLLPLDFHLQLYKDSRMPGVIDGVVITPEKLRRERVNLRLRPDLLDSPSTGLAPLLEAESDRVRLEMPGDVMRLGETIEFLDVKGNHLLEEKSARFRNAFETGGFTFPVRLIGGNPTTRKPYDEGCFLVDSAGAFFRLRQVRGEPELRRLEEMVAPEQRPRWAQLRPRHLHVQEQDNREVRLVIIDEDRAVHLALGEDYRLVTLPLRHFDPSTMQLRLRGDLRNRLVTVNSRQSVEAVVMTSDYEFIDRYTELLTPRERRPAGRVATVVFPFTVGFQNESSGYLGFHLTWGSRLAVGVNGALLALVALGWRWHRRPFRSGLPELAAVGVGGLYGCVLLWLLPRTE